MPGYHHVEVIMGTAISIDVQDDVTDRPGLDGVLTWFEHVDRTYSTYRSDSDITRVGTGELAVGDTTAEVRYVLARCDELRAGTDGVFDVWAVPAPNGTTLDPSAFVKGWSVEVAAALLEAEGLRSFCLNAGGDVLVRGTPSDASAWRIGIQSPIDRERIATAVELAGRGAVATSGTYERGAHLVDPRTGDRPAEVASATVIGPDLGIADALSTALFVLGVDGLDDGLLPPGYRGLIVAHDGTVVTTGADVGATPCRGR